MSERWSKMQKEIINQIKLEQDKLRQEINNENPEVQFFTIFLQQINFSDINTYNNISIEELIMAYVKSRDSNFSLNELKNIAEKIVPIFERCTSDEIHSLLLLIDDFATADNYEDIMDILYSEDKKIALEELIEDSKCDPEQYYVAPSAKKLEQKENERLINFIEVFHTNPEVWGYALLLVQLFYQIKEDQQLINKNKFKTNPMVKQQNLANSYDISSIKKVSRTIITYLNKLKAKQEKENQLKIREIKAYDRIITVLSKNSEEITDYRNILTNISNPSLRLEILKKIYQQNQEYYKTLEKKYGDLVENSKKGYLALCQKHRVENVDVEELMQHYSYKELEKILSVLKDMQIKNNSEALKNTSLNRIKEVVSLLDQRLIGIDIIKATPDIWNDAYNYPERIRRNTKTIRKITGSTELYERRSWVKLIDCEILQKNLETLSRYDLLNQLHTTTNYHFLEQDWLDEKIDFILELGKEKALTNNLGLLNYETLRWKRLQILESLNMPVEEEMLEGLLHTEHFLVPDEKIEEYIELNTLPIETRMNKEEILETPRTYVYGGVYFSKNKVKRNQLNQSICNWQEALITGRKFTPTEIKNISQNRLVN